MLTINTGHAQDGFAARIRLVDLDSSLFFSVPDFSAPLWIIAFALLGAAIMGTLGVIAGPAAGLLALVAPSGGEPNECAPLLQQMKEGKAPKTVKG